MVPNEYSNRGAIDDAVTSALESARQLVRARTGPAVWLQARIAELRG